MMKDLQKCSGFTGLDEYDGHKIIDAEYSRLELNYEITAREKYYLIIWTFRVKYLNR